MSSTTTDSSRSLRSSLAVIGGLLLLALLAVWGINYWYEHGAADSVTCKPPLVKQTIERNGHRVATCVEEHNLSPGMPQEQLSPTAPAGPLVPKAPRS